MNSEAKSPILASDVVIALLGFLARLFVGLVLLVVCFSVLKVHFEYWKQIEAKLPSITESMARHSLFMLKDGWLLAPVVALVDLGVTLVLVLRFRQHRWLSSAYSQVLLLASIAYLVWIYLGVSVPLQGLLQETTQP